MRTRIWATGLAVLLSLGALANAPGEKSAVILPGPVEDGWAGEDYSSGWEFTPAQDIDVTQLGLALAVGDDYLENEHTISIYDPDTGNALVSATFSKDQYLSVEADGYAYTDIADCPLTGGKMYVIALYAASVTGDTQIRTVAGEVFDPDITVGRTGLYTLNPAGPVIPTTDAGGDHEFLGASFKFTTGPVGPTPIDIDIKPGSYPNTINLGSNGVVPVGILSSESFDATTVPPETVFLAGADVAVRGKGNKYMAHEEDINGDGLMDLVVQVETENLDPGQFQDGYAVLKIHETSDPESPVLYQGSDEITIVPPE